MILQDKQKISLPVLLFELQIELFIYLFQCVKKAKTM